MYPFERFSEEAKKTLKLAQEEAERSHHSYIGTEHILLGILRNQEGTGFRVLQSLGVQIDEVRQTIESVLGRNERIIIHQIIPTSRVKHVIEIAFDEARRMGKNHVDSGHLLMALAIEGEGIAAHVLADLGASAERIVAAIEREMGVEPSGRGKEKSSTRIPIPSFRRTQVGPTVSLFGARQAVPEPSDAEALHRLMRMPHIADLLRRKGVDIDVLSKQLLSPPEEVLKLRRQLSGVRSELQTAIAERNYGEAARHQKKEIELVRKLEKAEQDWLKKLT